MIRNQPDPTTAAKFLVDHALARFSTDNLSCMVVRLDKTALLATTKEPSSAIGVEGDPLSQAGKISEVDKIVGDAKRKVQEDGTPGIGVSGSNSGKGHDPKTIEDEEQAKRISMEKVVEEEPGLTEGDAPKADVQGADASSSDTLQNLPEGSSK